AISPQLNYGSDDRKKRHDNILIRYQGVNKYRNEVQRQYRRKGCTDTWSEEINERQCYYSSHKQRRKPMRKLYFAWMAFANQGAAFSKVPYLAIELGKGITPLVIDECLRDEARLESRLLQSDAQLDILREPVEGKTFQLPEYSA